MIPVLIIEDEPHAAERLKHLLLEALPDGNVMATLESVRQSVAWLKTNPMPSLIFLDIHLADGISFEIFDQVRVTCPIIFTTAYDAYALKAFTVNSIDYILKPIDKADLNRSLEKFKRMNVANTKMMDSISLAMEMLTKKYKARFVIKVGEKLKSIEVADILYFYSQDKATFALTSDGRQHIIDFNMDQVEGLLDPARFFRINRKYLVAVDSIQDMVNHSNSRIKLILKNCSDDEVIVARERVQDFKSWLDR